MNNTWWRWTCWFWYPLRRRRPRRWRWWRCPSKVVRGNHRKTGPNTTMPGPTPLGNHLSNASLAAPACLSKE